MEARRREIASLMPRVEKAMVALPKGVVVKPCPRCGEVFQKEDEAQCDHMKCTSCDLEFCWTCLSDRAVIEAHGNHYHTPACRFWFEPPHQEPAVQYLVKCRTCRKTGTPCRPPLVASDVPVPPVPLSDRESLELHIRMQERRDKRQFVPSGKDFKWAAFGVKRQSSTCKICLSDFESGDDVRELHCGHAFHSPCINEWVKHGGQCPTCKLRPHALGGA